MEIKAFDDDFLSLQKIFLYCSRPFAEQLFAERLLVEHLSMTASIK